MPYFHVVYTLPAQIADIAYQNKAVIYDLLFKASAATTLTIAADPKHLGARIGFISVLHTWGSALTHHPHVHMVVPGGGLSPEEEMKSLFGFLHVLHGTLWEAYFNGRKPDLAIPEFVLPPAPLHPGGSMKAGERVFREGHAVLTRLSQSSLIRAEVP